MAVVFETKTIGVARVEKRRDAKPLVRLCEFFDRSSSHDKETLKRLDGRLKLRRHRLTTLLHHGRYQMLQVDAPAGDPAEARDIVRWRIKEMVDFPIEKAGIDLLPVPPVGSRTPQPWAVVASHDVLRPIIHLFQDARLPLAAIDIPELAQRNVSALFEQENRGLALLAFDEEGGRLTLTWQGELYASRRVEVNRSTLAEANDSLGGIFERVLLDVQRSLDNFERNFSAIAISRLLLAPLPENPAFVDYLRSNLYQPVAVLDLAEVLDLGEVPALTDARLQALALPLIGAALRDEEAA